MAKSSSRPNVSELIKQAKNRTQINAPEEGETKKSVAPAVDYVEDDDEDVDTEQDTDTEDDDTEDDSADATPAKPVEEAVAIAPAVDFAERDDESTLTLGGSFLNRVFRFDPSLAHRAIADMMLTDLSQVGDHLREWYSKSKPEEFADYVIAKDNTFQFLIKEYVMFDEDTDFAHAVSHWFVNSMGLRKAR